MSMQNLVDLNQMVEELNSTNSSNAKKEILGKYPQCQELLKWTYDPFKKFHVTSKNVKKNSEMVASNCPGNIVGLLSLLSEQKLSGHAAIKTVNKFIAENKEYEELILNILDKNLKTRTDAKLINKVFPDLVPGFEVALAAKWEPGKVDFENETWLASRKMDGCRCVAVKDNSNVTFYSRSGKEFETLRRVGEQIMTLASVAVLPNQFVLDGEICLVDENGDEDFQGVMKQIRKKDHTIQNPLYKVFDYLSFDEFFNNTPGKPFRDRYKEDICKLHSIAYMEEIPCLDFVHQIEIPNEEFLLGMQKSAVEQGWEGLIIRKNVPYKGGRSKDLLKVKKFFDDEYVVKSIETGPIRFVTSDFEWRYIMDLDVGNLGWLPEDGYEIVEEIPSDQRLSKDIILCEGKFYRYSKVEKEEEMLTAIHIDHKGHDVRVGSGFSMEQRKEFFKDPSLIIGKTITVVYFEETKNQNGGLSLRFPTLKVIHGDKREV